MPESPIPAATETDKVGPPPGKRPRHHSRKRRTRRIVAALIERDGDLCAYCRQPFDEERPATVDHVVPRSRGGSNELDNLVAACRPCNQAKGAMSAVAFRGLLELALAA